jgi:hypothetical protein
MGESPAMVISGTFTFTETDIAFSESEAKSNTDGSTFTDIQTVDITVPYSLSQEGSKQQLIIQGGDGNTRYWQGGYTKQ